MVKFINKIDLNKLLVNSEKAIESALDEQADELTRLSSKEVPKKDKALLNSAEKDKIGKDTIMISYNEPYASYQHEGKRKDGSRVVKRYTTPGTKKFYIKDPLENNSGKWASIIVKNFKKEGF
jgi:hypothetical protein